MHLIEIRYLYGSTTRMAGRRQSMTAQISRQARRLSAVIVPQFTKIEPVNILQKVEGVEIRLNDMAQYQRAVDQYIMRNSVTFDPVEFNVLDPGGYRIMQASLYPEGLHVYEGKRKVCEVSLANDEDSPSCIAKIKHPVTSMTVYELRDMGGTICIQTSSDEIHSTRIVPDRPTCMSLLFACGCAFSKEKWLVLEQDTTRAIIAPVSSFFEENSMKIEWATCSDNEIRLIAVSFGLAQMVRVAFPSLLHILKEFRSRRG
ncbi:hypothetical protein Y032_0614g681 [Ancylostoma ceylanicum]|uniref:Phospholipid scramblase n=1 Tax=Ancylostoma ceylanicum TaxID=53326 RepID=A0A016WL67_9BILA|nr:hypothetical protein Y032_0614g681 [Ancylostoma ceylanicum]